MATYNQRVAEVSAELIEGIREVLTRNKVDYEEYHAALMWMMELAKSGELPMFVDNFFERTVESASFAGLPGSEGTVQGPYYRPGAPVLTKTPLVIPMRADEPGVPMVLNGEVVDLEGKPVAGALVDMWHSGNDGTYSGFVGDAPPFNLRAKFYTDDKGRFQILTIRPAPYQIPTQGPTGRYLETINRHAWRPAHFHLKISAVGVDPLTTQIYFTGGPWLDGDGDVSGAVKDSLMVDVIDSSDEDTAQRYGLDLPFSAVDYTFRLRPERV